MREVQRKADLSAGALPSKPGSSVHHSPSRGGTTYSKYPAGASPPILLIFTVKLMP